MSTARRTFAPQGGLREAGAPWPGGREQDGRIDSLRREVFQRLDVAAAARMEEAALEAALPPLIIEASARLRLSLTRDEIARIAVSLVDDMLGLGPLEPLLADATITDILVNGPDQVFVERAGRMTQVPARFRDAGHLLHVAQRIAARAGRRVDESCPMVDARLPDGGRVNIVLPPLSLGGPTLSIRRFAAETITLERMVAQRNLSAPIAAFLRVATGARLNMLISGGSGSGKTTLLNAAARHIGASERVITIEDTAELRLDHGHVVRLEARPANLEGRGAVALRELLRNALRMRPDRIIIGEVRGDESLDLLQAMNTGHQGSMSTLHANSARDALLRLETLALLAGADVPLRALRLQILQAVDLIVHLERGRDGVRRVVQILEPVGLEGEMLVTRDLARFGAEGEGGLLAARPRCHAKILKAGFADAFEACLGRGS